MSEPRRPCRFYPCGVALRDRDGNGARTFASLGAWAYVAGAGLLMMTQAIGWTGNGRVASLQALTPYVIAGLIPVCGLGLWLGRERLAMTASVIGLSGLALAVPFAFPPSQRAPAEDAAGLRAAAVNLLYGNPSADQVADDLLDRDLDVLVLIEYTFEHEDVFENHALVEQFPYRVDHNDPKARGMALWSRYPVTQDREARTFGLDVTIEGPDGEMRVMGVHPQTPVWNFDRWIKGLELIGDRALADGPPTLIIGDLNASYWNPAFRDLLDRGFIDAHLAVGDRLGRSWPTDRFVPPIAQIDHALLGDGLVATDIENFDVAGSDHKGFVVTVAPAR